MDGDCITTPTFDSRRTRSRRARAALVGCALALVVAVGAPASVGAHDDIKSSDPVSRSRIVEPISKVLIDFGEPIGDDTSLFLTYDLGDAEIEEIGGDTFIIGPTTAELRFDEIERQGTYFVQYLAPVPTDGHVIAGAISFTWGDPSSNESSFPLVPFLAVSALALAVGGWFSYRRMLVGPDDSDDGRTPA